MKKQEGFVEDSVIIGLAALLVIGTVWYFVSLSNYTNEYNAWVAQCYREGGVVQRYSATRDECFINGKLTVLKGWEKYAE